LLSGGHLLVHRTYILDIKVTRIFMSLSRTAYSVDNVHPSTRIANAWDILLAISFHFVTT